MKYEILRFLKRTFINPFLNPILKFKAELGYKKQFEALKQYIDVRALCEYSK